MNKEFLIVQWHQLLPSAVPDVSLQDLSFAWTPTQILQACSVQLLVHHRSYS